jgi:hypothetical protein
MCTALANCHDLYAIFGSGRSCKTPPTHCHVTMFPTHRLHTPNASSHIQVSIVTAVEMGDDDDIRPYSFRIATPSRTYIMAAEDMFECHEWVGILRARIQTLGARIHKVYY